DGKQLAPPADEGGSANICLLQLVERCIRSRLSRLYSLSESARRGSAFDSSICRMRPPSEFVMTHSVPACLGKAVMRRSLPRFWRRWLVIPGACLGNDGIGNRPC